MATLEPWTFGVKCPKCDEDLVFDVKPSLRLKGDTTLAGGRPGVVYEMTAEVAKPYHVCIAAAEADVTKRRVLVYGRDSQSASMWVWKSGTRYTSEGWSIALASGFTDPKSIRGKQFHMTVCLVPVLDREIAAEIQLATRLGDNPRIVTADHDETLEQVWDRTA